MYIFHSILNFNNKEIYKLDINLTAYPIGYLSSGLSYINDVITIEFFHFSFVHVLDSLESKSLLFACLSSLLYCFLPQTRIQIQVAATMAPINTTDIEMMFICSSVVQQSLPENPYGHWSTHFLVPSVCAM